jgi:hypothetical protein
MDCGAAIASEHYLYITTRIAGPAHRPRPRRLCRAGGRPGLSARTPGRAPTACLTARESTHLLAEYRGQAQQRYPSWCAPSRASTAGGGAYGASGMRFHPQREDSAGSAGTQEREASKPPQDSATPSLPATFDEIGSDVPMTAEADFAPCRSLALQSTPTSPRWIRIKRTRCMRKPPSSAR